MLTENMVGDEKYYPVLIETFNMEFNNDRVFLIDFNLYFYFSNLGFLSI